MIDKYGEIENQAFFAVYDGHAGSEMAEALSKRLHKVHPKYLLQKIQNFFLENSSSYEFHRYQ